jgi:hypothetical protein
MKWPRNNYNNYNNSKNDFWKWSKSTALHHLLSTIPSEDNNDNTNTTKTKTTKEKIVLTWKNSATKSDLWFLEGSYFKTRYEELLSILLHDTSFYSDMFETKTDIYDIKKYYYKKWWNKIDDESNTNQSSKIKFEQLYKKFQKKKL